MSFKNSAAHRFVRAAAGNCSWRRSAWVESRAQAEYGTTAETLKGTSGHEIRYGTQAVQGCTGGAPQ
jgi:hypothetical protein